jgi:Zinc knuckle
MDADALTMERAMLLRQGKCFHCKKTGHMVKDCLSLEQGKTSKQKKMDLARFAYTAIKALTKEKGSLCKHGHGRQG